MVEFLLMWSWGCWFKSWKAPRLPLLTFILCVFMTSGWRLHGRAPDLSALIVRQVLLEETRALNMTYLSRLETDWTRLLPACLCCEPLHECVYASESHTHTRAQTCSHPSLEQISSSSHLCQPAQQDNSDNSSARSRKPGRWNGPWRAHNCCTAPQNIQSFHFIFHKIGCSWWPIAPTIGRTS